MSDKDRLAELFSELGLDRKPAQAQHLFETLSDLRRLEDWKRDVEARLALIARDMGWGQAEIDKLTEAVPLLCEAVEFNKIIGEGEGSA